MTNKLKNLLRKVFLGSLAGIAASNTSSANTNMTVFEPAETDNKFESILNREPDLSPKLVLKKKLMLTGLLCLIEAIGRINHTGRIILVKVAAMFHIFLITQVQREGPHHIPIQEKKATIVLLILVVLIIIYHLDIEI